MSAPRTAEGVSAFLERKLKERGPSLSAPHRKSLARKATHFGHLGERMSQGQEPLLDTDFESHVRSGQRPVPDFIMEVVADLDGKEQVSMEDVRGFAQRLLVVGRPSSRPEWEYMDYWTCFVLSVLGRGEGSKLKQLSLIRLSDDECLALAVNLISNSRVEFLSLQAVWFLREANSDPKWGTALGAHCVAEAVRLNRVLHSLHCTFECVTLEPLRGSMQLSGAETVTPYLEALTPGLDGSHPTSSIRMFTLGLSGGYNSLKTIVLRGDASREVGRALGTMISRNKTLTGLTLSRITFEEPLWLESLIPGLTMNAFLKVLDLKGSVFSVSLGIEALKEAFTDLLLSTNAGGLEEINLQGTALDLYAGQLKEILRIKRAYRGKFQEQVQAPPTCGRIVLCGYQYAGKTTLCETMVRSSSYGSHRSFSQRWRRARKKFMITHPRLRRLLFGSRAAEELSHRTRGVDIMVLRDTPRRTSLWDFAGQTEYYALHDYVFPDVKNSCFVYVCSAILPPDDPRVGNSSKIVIKGKQEMQAELQYWMRFIASNSKPINDPKLLPRMLFVLTNKDRLNNEQVEESLMWAEKVVEDLGTQFQRRIALQKTVAIVDGHSHTDVDPIMEGVEEHLKQILEQSREYVLCEHVRGELLDWSSKNPRKPILDMKLFEAQICTKVRKRAWEEASKALNENDHQETILEYLNETGDIIFSRSLDFIVVNPKWFGIDVLGSIISAFSHRGRTNGSTMEWRGLFACLHVNEPCGGWAHDGGFVTRRSMGKLLNTSLRTAHLRQLIAEEDLIKLLTHLELFFEEDPVDEGSRLFVPSLFEDTDLSVAGGRRKLSWKLDRPGRPGEIHFGRRLECEDASLTFLTPGFFHRAQVRLRNYVQEKKWANAFQVDKHLLGFAENGVEVLVEYSGHIGYFVDILVKSSKPFAEALEFVQREVIQKLREFCAGPQGCQGVVLEECVIRPSCVKRPDVCEDRRDQAVKVSELNDKVKADPKYLYCWGVDNRSDYGIDLLEGEGSYRKTYGEPTQAVIETLEDIATSVPRDLYFVADNNWLTSIVSKGEYGPVMSVWLHAKCDYDHHEVENQRGRLLQIKGTNNINLVKHGANLVGLAVKAGTEMVGAGVVGKALERFVQNAFKTPSVLPVPMEILLKGFIGKSALSADVIRELQRYVLSEDSKRWLSMFFDVEGSAKFYADFKLRKGRRGNQVVWACDPCYQIGLGNGELQ